MISFIKKGTSTKDATATADDILFPATAYSQGEKLVGAIETVYDQSGSLREISRKGEDLYNTDDATATSNDLLSPETAYVDGGKIVGAIMTTRQSGYMTSYDINCPFDTSKPRTICIEANIAFGYKTDVGYVACKIINGVIDIDNGVLVTIDNIIGNPKLCLDNGRLFLYYLLRTNNYNGTIKIYEINTTTLENTFKTSREFQHQDGYQSYIDAGDIFVMPNNSKYIGITLFERYYYGNTNRNGLHLQYAVLYYNETSTVQLYYDRFWVVVQAMGQADIVNAYYDYGRYGYWVPNSNILYMYGSKYFVCFDVTSESAIVKFRSETAPTKFPISDTYYITSSGIYTYDDTLQNTISITLGRGFVVIPGKIFTKTSMNIYEYEYDGTTNIRAIESDSTYSNYFIEANGNNNVLYRSQADVFSYYADDKSGKITALTRDNITYYAGYDATATANDLLSPKTAYVNGGKITGGMLTTRKPGGFSNNTLETNYNIRAISIEASIVVINDNGTYKLGKIVNNSIDDDSLTDITLSGTTDIKLCYDGTNLVLFCCSNTTMYVYDVNLNTLVIALRITKTLQNGSGRYGDQSTHGKVYSQIFPMPNNPSYIAVISYDSVYGTGSYKSGCICFQIFNIVGVNANSIYFNEDALMYRDAWQWNVDINNNPLYCYWVPNEKMLCMFESSGSGIYVKRRNISIDSNNNCTLLSSDTSRFYLDSNHYLINNTLYNISEGTSETVSYAENTSNGNFTMANGKIISLINGALKLYTYNSELETITLDNSYVSTDNKYLIQDGNNIVIYSSSATNKSYLMDDGNGDIIAIKRGNTTYYSTTDSDTVASQVLNKKIVYTSNGKIVGTMPNNGAVSYVPTTSQQNIANGYHNGSTIAAVTAEIDSNITPTNIRSGVTILGVQGNLEPDKPDQTKTVIPTAAQQVVTGDIGYELASVTVESLTLSEEYERCNELAALILGD